jgi:general stress protein 26
MHASDHRDTFINVLKSFDVGMLATRGGSLHARPMRVAEVNDDGTLIFVTSLESHKVAEIDHDPRALVTFQGHARYVSAVGGIHIVKDKYEIRQMWQESWRVWFPHGLDDPSICLLRFEIYQGEYWNMSGASGVKYLFEAARAYFSGRTPTLDATQHAYFEM